MTKKTSVIGYCGYGSLVNLDTLRTPYISAHRVRLSGWQRVWLKRPPNVPGFSTFENLAFLSVQPAPQDVGIDGLIILDHASSLPDVDRRELHYDRLAVVENDIEWLDGHPGADSFDELYIYCASATQAGSESRILRSYLDAVLQGYLRAFGEAGLADFKASVQNGDLPVLEDRSDPIYPRSVELTESERALIDLVSGAE